MLLSAGAAQAQMDLINFEFIGGGETMATNVDELGFSTAPLTQFQDDITMNGIIEAGESYIVSGVGSITSFLRDPGSTPIPGTGLLSSYEITFSYELTYTVASVNPVAGGIEVNLNQALPGTLTLLFDGTVPPFADGATGTGFLDGMTIATFTSAPTGATNDGGSLTIDTVADGEDVGAGDVRANFQATTFNCGFFQTQGGDDFCTLVDDADNPIILAFSQGDLQGLPGPDNAGFVLPAGADVYTLGSTPAGPDGVNQQTNGQFFTSEQGSISLSTLSEPASLGMLGLGLLGLGFTLRRRQRVVA